MGSLELAFNAVFSSVAGVLVIFYVWYFIFFLRRYISTNYKMYGYLTILFLTFLLRNFFHTAMLIFQETDLILPFFLLREIFDMLTVYSLVVLLEVFEKDRGFSLKQSILTIFVFAAIGAMISNPSYDINLDDIPIIRFSDDELILEIEVAMFSIAGTWLNIMLYRNYKTAWSTHQKKMMLWLSWGVFLMTTLPFISIVISISLWLLFPDVALLILLIYSYSGSFGIVFVGFAFSKASKEPWLLQRRRAHFILIASKEGIGIFSKVFNKEMASEKMLLFAGGFSAISTMIKEITDTSGDIRSITLEDKVLRIINKEHFISALLVDFPTQASEIAHEKFVKKFEKLYSDELKEFDGETSIFNYAEVLIQKYFS